MNVQVVSFLANGPIGRCGMVETGDLLVAVDGIQTEGKQIKEVRRLLTGADGSAVELKFLGARDGRKDVFSITVCRQPPPKTGK